MTTSTSMHDEAQPRVGRLLLLAVLIGILASLGAVAFVAVETELQHFLWTFLPEQFGWTAVPWWWVVSALLIGAVLTWAATQLPGQGGHFPLDQMAMTIGPRSIVSVVLAALASLSFGAVVGPEAPLVAVGTAVAAAVYRNPKAGERQIIMAAGGVAAMGMILGNPLVTAILVLEAATLVGSPGGRDAMTRILPVLVALGFGYVIQVGVGDWGGFGESVLAVPGLPTYDNVMLIDTLVAIPLALVVALVAVAAIRTGERVRLIAESRPLPTILVAGGVVSFAAVIVTALTGASVDTVLFSGQSAIPEVLTITSVGTLVAIGIGKAIGYAASLGSGFRGGRIFPAVYLGVVLAVLASVLMDQTNVSALAAAGIAAGAGAALKLPFTSALLALLLCSAAGAAVTTTAIIGAIIGVLVAAAIEARSAKDEAPGAVAGKAAS